MDLTPAALRETTFRGALRGYNVDDVDEFVERVAVGVGELLEQLRLNSERVAAAERRAKDIATSEDAMKRTLGHAQKLAEAVLAEARQEAARLTDEARQAAAQLRANARDDLVGEQQAAEQARVEADRLRREADADRVAVRAEGEAVRAAAKAEADAERAAAKAELDTMLARAAEGIDADVRAEVDRLHEVRRALQLDVAVLTSWMHDQRAAVRNVLVETLAAIDRSAPTDEPPPITEVDTSIRIGDHPVEAAAVTADPAPQAAAPASPAGPVASVTSADAPPASTPALEPEPQPEPQPEPEPEPAVTAAGSEPTEPATASFPELSDEEFLAELKKAASDGDDSPLGPREKGHWS